MEESELEVLSNGADVLKYSLSPITQELHGLIDLSAAADWQAGLCKHWIRLKRVKKYSYLDWMTNAALTNYSSEEDLNQWESDKQVLHDPAYFK